jgi:hypothetical protein
VGVRIVLRRSREEKISASRTDLGRGTSAQPEVPKSARGRCAPFDVRVGSF